jgi:hypothetical protein
VPLGYVILASHGGCYEHGSSDQSRRNIWLLERTNGPGFVQDVATKDCALN